MQAMIEVTNPLAREQTMTKVQDKAKIIAIKELLERDEDFVRSAVQSFVQAALEAEMTEALSAEKGERTEGRLGYRSGYYSRALITRVGTLELRVPQDRAGRFSTELFERYQRSEKALVGTLAEMYVQGVSTRKVKAVTEALCGHSFSASSISAINKTLDASLKAFSERRLSDAYPYLILDARYERIREGGVITNQAVLIAVAVDWEGRRQILAVELANRESRSSWRDFLFRKRGLSGVEFVVSDDHAGLKAAIGEVLPEAVWQRCYVHFLRNALKVDDDCRGSCGGSTTGASLPKSAATSRPGSPNGRRNIPSSAPGWKRTSRRRSPTTVCASPPQAYEVDEYAGTAEPGDQATHACVAHLPKPGELSSARPSPCCRDARELARGHALSQHGSLARA